MICTSFIDEIPEAKKHMNVKFMLFVEEEPAEDGDTTETGGAEGEGDAEEGGTTDEEGAEEEGGTDEGDAEEEDKDKEEADKDGGKEEEKSDEGDKGGAGSLYPTLLTISTTLVALISPL